MSVPHDRAAVQPAAGDGHWVPSQGHATAAASGQRPAASGHRIAKHTAGLSRPFPGRVIAHERPDMWAVTALSGRPSRRDSERPLQEAGWAAVTWARPQRTGARGADPARPSAPAEASAPHPAASRDAGSQRKPGPAQPSAPALWFPQREGGQAGGAPADQASPLPAGTARTGAASASCGRGLGAPGKPQ